MPAPDDRVRASTETLLRQASLTAADYLASALHYINEQFEHISPNFALQHLELVADFMKVSGHDFNAAVHTRAIENGSEEIADAIKNGAERIADAIESVAAALRDIAAKKG